MSIGWVHFSSDDRKRVASVIDLLNEGGVIDELGVGIVRNSYADAMFPGISTIQTRAKYFTLTAYLLKEYIRKWEAGYKQPPMDKYLRDAEKYCRIVMLRKANGEDELEEGVIGRTFGLKSNQDVVRRASSIYWSGLRIYGFLNTQRSLSEFIREFNEPGKHLARMLSESSDKKGDDLDAEYSLPLVNAPNLPEDYLSTLSINLLASEAKFLRAQIETRRPDSLIAQILLDEEATKQVIQLEDLNFNIFAQLPFINELKDRRMRQLIHHANKFWQILYGAHVRYNCLLQKRHGTDTKLNEYEEEWLKWQDSLPEIHKSWDPDFFWGIIHEQNGQVPEGTTKFINAWFEESKSGARNHSKCDSLVTQQERYNKGERRAKLAAHHKDAIGDWVGLRELNFRQRQARRIVADIVSAEKAGPGA